MKFITRDTDYAVRALVFMAHVLQNKKRKLVTIDEIIQREHLPERFMRRIFLRLAKNKIVFSYKGKSGGFTFLVKPARIKLTDIIRIFQGDIDLAYCFLKGKVCPNTRICKIRKRIKSINPMLIKEFNKITVASLL